MCALDMDNGKIWWGVDGTFYASGNPATGTNAAFDDLNLDAGMFMAFSDYNSGTDGECTINAIKTLFVVQNLLGVQTQVTLMLW